MFSSVYGSWEPLDSLEILPRGVGTFRPPGKPLPRIFKKTKNFDIFSIVALKTINDQKICSHIGLLGGVMHTNACGTSNSYRLPELPHRMAPTRVELFELPSKNTSKHPNPESDKSGLWGTTFFECIFEKHTFEKCVHYV